MLDALQEPGAEANHPTAEQRRLRSLLLRALRMWQTNQFLGSKTCNHTLSCVMLAVVLRMKNLKHFANGRTVISSSDHGFQACGSMLLEV